MACTRGRTSSSANCRTASRNICSSSLSAVSGAPAVGSSTVAIVARPEFQGVCKRAPPEPRNPGIWHGPRGARKCAADEGGAVRCHADPVPPAADPPGRVEGMRRIRCGEPDAGNAAVAGKRMPWRTPDAAPGTGGPMDRHGGCVRNPGVCAGVVCRRRTHRRISILKLSTGETDHGQQSLRPRRFLGFRQRRFLFRRVAGIWRRALRRAHLVRSQRRRPRPAAPSAPAAPRPGSAAAPAAEAPAGRPTAPAARRARAARRSAAPPPAEARAARPAPADRWAAAGGDGRIVRQRVRLVGLVGRGDAAGELRLGRILGRTRAAATIRSRSWARGWSPSWATCARA